MSAQHTEPGGFLIPRPERGPAALRVALAQVAPHRLAEMEQQKDEAIALAARTDSLGPIVQFLEAWAVVIEIARFPAVSARLHSAEYAAQVLDREDPAWQAAMNEIQAVYLMARESLAHE
ncbi:hypothetical protein ACIOUE_29510 [Streptomyces xanthochromogenes]|uniref:hypothetical protein n=1 Tax=Streptomyces TaxID=1883 RepID=UPI00136D9047|nr:hypothetical protein [Streptomyces sp. SID1034]MYV93532.1 hypothetical protein [Streptomyces sp. SID1034]